ncbi:Ataxin-10 [Varanus komodoensis]|nr:Ataxin-10 [Varanus komodoensis]
MIAVLSLQSSVIPSYVNVSKQGVLFHSRTKFLELILPEMNENDSVMNKEIARFLACCFEEKCHAVLKLASATNEADKWAVYTICNLTEENERNQEYIAKMERQELANNSVLESMGLKVEQRDQKLLLKSVRKMPNL